MQNLGQTQIFYNLGQTRLTRTKCDLDDPDNWFCFYLTNRSQRVVINGHYSEWLPVLSGVPQGLILGPLLFILYINDLYSLVKSSSLKIYADDVALYAAVSSYQDCVNL